MIKKYGLALDSVQLDQFRELVPERIRRKSLETFLFDHYIPSQEITNPVNQVSVQKRGRGRPSNKDNENTISTNMGLSDDAIKKIDSYVDQLKSKGASGVNRSSVLRDVLLNFNQFYTGKDIFSSPSERIPNTFYLENGTHEFLQKWTKSRNLSYVIEQFILDPKKISLSSINDDDLTYLKTTPLDLEPIRISISRRAYQVIDDIIASLNSDITRTSFMRLVIKRLIKSDRGIALPKLLAKRKLDTAILNYENIAGTDKTKELISEYLNQTYDTGKEG